MKYSWVSVAYFIFYTLVFGWLFVTLLIITRNIL
jgi:hypothetical protein